MSDLERDTRVEGDAGVYRANVSQAWEIWGPNGGYLGAIALRAAGKVARIARPVSFYCHFVRPARFSEIELTVTLLHLGRQAESLRVSASQEGKPVLEAMIRTAAIVPGLEHDDSDAPVVAPPESLPRVEDLRLSGSPRFAFWDNFDVRVVQPERFVPERQPRAPRWSEWYRFRPQATFADPFADAGRALVLIDTLSWPAAHLQHPKPAYIAPSLDVVAFFHRPAHHSAWLLADQRSPVADGGLMGGYGRVFDEAGKLVATGGAQLLCVPAR